MKAAGRLAAMVGDKSRTRRERIEKMLCEFTGLAMQALVSRAAFVVGDNTFAVSDPVRQKIAAESVKIAEETVSRLLQWGEEGDGDEADA